jgi:hypothetical protein
VLRFAYSLFLDVIEGMGSAFNGSREFGSICTPDIVDLLLFNILGGIGLMCTLEIVDLLLVDSGAVTSSDCMVKAIALLIIAIGSVETKVDVDMWRELDLEAWRAHMQCAGSCSSLGVSPRETSCLPSTILGNEPELKDMLEGLDRR